VLLDKPDRAAVEFRDLRSDFSPTGEIWICRPVLAPLVDDGAHENRQLVDRQGRALVEVARRDDALRPLAFADLVFQIVERLFAVVLLGIDRALVRFRIFARSF
jgi:hypothetical protein